MSFRLGTIFYVFALVAAAMATFGTIGLYAAGAVSLFWIAVYSQHRPKTAIEWITIIAVALILLALVLPAIDTAREFSRTTQCRHQLRQIALALLHYDTKNGRLPPAVATNERGVPLLSWRGLILPRLERNDVYESIDQTQAWDAPVNAATTATAVDTFVCPSHPALPTPTSDCSYFAVIGSHTPWPGDRSRRFDEITDPKSHTILVIESHDRHTPWAKPSDLTFDEAVTLLTSANPPTHLHSYRPTGGLFAQLLGKTGNGIHVAMADGSVHFLALPLPKDLAIALLTVDGNEGDLHDQLDYYTRPQLDIGKCYGLGVFVLLSLLPVVPLLRRSAQSAMKSADISP